MLPFFLQDFFWSRSAYAKTFGAIKSTKLCQFFGENLRVDETGHIFDWKHGEMLPFFSRIFLKLFSLCKKIGTIKCTKLCRFCCENLWVNEIGHFFYWKQGEMLPFFLQDFFAAVRLMPTNLWLKNAQSSVDFLVRTQGSMKLANF